jgi:hypothetical protein
MQLFSQVGPITAPQTSLGQGLPAPMRSGSQGDLICSELQGRFYEATYRQQQFSIGHTTAFALTSTCATATGLTATATPILGIYNPLSSTVNAAIDLIAMANFINNVTCVAPGAFVWTIATGQSTISTGLTPWNRKTLAQSGSQVKGFAGATALTGLVGSLTIMEAVELPIASGLLTTSVAATTPTPSVSGLAVYDGSLIVPPGGVLALMCTLSTTTFSVNGRLQWKESGI